MSLLLHSHTLSIPLLPHFRCTIFMILILIFLRDNMDDNSNWAMDNKQEVSFCVPVLLLCAFPLHLFVHSLRLLLSTYKYLIRTSSDGLLSVQMIDIIETVYRGASKGRGLVVSPKGKINPPPCTLYITDSSPSMTFCRLLDALPLLSNVRASLSSYLFPAASTDPGGPQLCAWGISRALFCSLVRCADVYVVASYKHDAFSWHHVCCGDLYCISLLVVLAMYIIVSLLERQHKNVPDSVLH